MDKKLARLRELIELKDKTDKEIAELLGEEKPKRPYNKKPKEECATVE